MTQHQDLAAGSSSRWSVRVHMLFLGSKDVGPAFDPGDLTDLIGVTPTRQWQVGDLNQLGVPRSTSGWELSSTSDATAALACHIQNILDCLQGHEQAFTLTAQRYRVQLQCVIQVDGATASPQLVVPLNQLRALADLGVAAVGFEIG